MAMSIHEDEDGIDGPFERAMDAAMKDDRKKKREPRPDPEPMMVVERRRGHWINVPSMTRRSAEAILDWAERTLPPGEPNKLNRSIPNAYAFQILRGGLASVSPHAGIRSVIAKNILRACR